MHSPFGPKTILGAAEAFRHLGVNSPISYQAAQLDALNRRGEGAELHIVTTVVPARVNHGRWVVSCPCGNVCVVGWGVARCFSCGAVFEGVVLPDNADAIEAVLLERPVPNRNWVPSETVDQLKAEHHART